jgi:feruloyl esterase
LLIPFPIDYYPSPCELNAITNFAIKACDELDGVKDGIVSMPGLCRFDPLTLIGKKVQCTSPNGTIKLSRKSAKFAAAIWAGPKDSNGSSLWYGLTPDAPLTGIGGTTCSSLDECKPSPFFLSTDWLATFLSRNSSLDLSTIGLKEYQQLFHASVAEFKSVIGTRDPNLTNFKESGNKMITWHGMKDPYAMYNGTVDYYDRARTVDPRVGDYYRFFAAPGVEHCSGGPGWFPGDGFKALVDWVEHGKAPDTLFALATPTATGTANLPTRTARLCAYPKILTYTKGNPNKASSFTCK